MMKYDPEKHHRRSIRLQGYDYSQAGAYYVTIVTQGRACLFGEVVDGTMRLNEYGEIVAEAWQWLEQQYAYVDLGIWVVMPNHLHGIIILDEYGAFECHEKKIVGKIGGRFQDCFHKEDQYLERYRRRIPVAAQLLRAYHPR